jgi:hypothetical protein
LEKASSSLSTEQRRAMCLATRETAIAFIEDMDHFREILDRESSRGEIRRVSASLRRILIERDIASIAAPRIGRIIFKAPDNREPHRFSRQAKITFFGSAGIPVYGLQIRGLMVHDSTPNATRFNPEDTIDLRLNNFVSQSVICVRGQWIARGAIIKYVANIASGVHSGAARAPDDILIATAREFAKYSKKPMALAANIHINFNAPPTDSTTFRYEPDEIDPVLVEVLATAHFLNISPDVQKLEKGLRAEVASPASPETLWP